MIGNVGIGNFYQSKPWINLMARLRLERVNDNGDLICEHCGEPITRAYDCIGHHIVELNDRNVSDASISLNPDNIMLIHHRCHNKIHNKLAYGESVRRVYLVYGAPCAGKSSFVRENMEQGDLIVDVDNIWQCVSGCDRFVKPARLNSNVFVLRDTLLEQVRYRTGKWLTAWVVGGYPLTAERERLCKSLGAREIFIDTTRDECLQRLHEANDGRDVEEWTRYISDWFDKYTPPLA